VHLCVAGGAENRAPLRPAASANTISHFERSEMSRQRVNRVKRESNSACCVAVYVCVEQSCQVPLVFCFFLSIHVARPLSLSGAPCGWEQREKAANRLTHARAKRKNQSCLSGATSAEESASGSLSVTVAIFPADTNPATQNCYLCICHAAYYDVESSR
jgi:hypothetical protein